MLEGVTGEMRSGMLEGRAEGSGRRMRRLRAKREV